MPRTKQYDRNDLREALVTTFLEKGFAGASLADLEERSGLNRRQLYNDVGDKLAMFVQALDDFADMAAARFLVPLERGTDGLADIRDTLFGLIDAGETPEGRLGCLICNTAREAIAHDPDVAPRVDRYFRRIEHGYHGALERAVSSGALGPGFDPVAMSRMLLAVHISLCVMGRAGEDLDVMRDAAHAALTALDSQQGTR